MAERPKGYGMPAEFGDKIDSKYSVESEIEVRNWIEDVLGKPISNEETANMEPGSERLHKELKDGQVLCRLLNVIRPGTVPKINNSKMSFKQMENIGHFLDGCEELGMHKTNMFQTVDLYEKASMYRVVLGVSALGRKATNIGFDGPKFGPR